MGCWELAVLSFGNVLECNVIFQNMCCYFSLGDKTKRQNVVLPPTHLPFLSTWEPLNIAWGLGTESWGLSSILGSSVSPGVRAERCVLGGGIQAPLLLGTVCSPQPQYVFAAEKPISFLMMHQA